MENLFLAHWRGSIKHKEILSEIQIFRKRWRATKNIYNWWLEESIDYGNGGWDKSVYKNTQMVTIAKLAVFEKQQKNFKAKFVIND